MNQLSFDSKWLEASEKYKRQWQMAKEDEDLWREWADLFTSDPPPSGAEFYFISHIDWVRPAFVARFWMVHVFLESRALPFYWPRDKPLPSQELASFLEEYRNYIHQDLRPLLAELFLVLVQQVPGKSVKDWLPDQNLWEVDVLPPPESLISNDLHAAGRFLLDYLGSLPPDQQFAFFWRIPWQRLMPVVSEDVDHTNSWFLNLASQQTNLTSRVRQLADLQVQLWLFNVSEEWTDQYWSNLQWSNELPATSWPGIIRFMLLGRNRHKLLFEGGALWSAADGLATWEPQLVVKMLNVAVGNAMEAPTEENEPHRWLRSDLVEDLLSRYGNWDVNLSRQLQDSLEILKAEEKSRQHEWYAQRDELQQTSSRINRQYTQVLAAMWSTPIARQPSEAANFSDLASWLAQD